MLSLKHYRSSQQLRVMSSMKADTGGSLDLSCLNWHLPLTCGPWGRCRLVWTEKEGGELGRPGQVSEYELCLEMHDVVGTLEYWMVSGGWRASFPHVASDHRHYPENKRENRLHWSNF